MEQMILYHGSTQIVEFPEIRTAKYHKDFYFGFYCTLLPEQAIRWATRFSGTEILNEYFEIMQRLINLEVAEYVIKTIINSSFVQFIDPYYHFGLIEADPDDNKFVDCAIAANAQFIVTNDHHYNVLHQIDFRKVNVINIDDFLDLVINH